MRVFTLNDAERAYHAIGLPKLMWEHFEKALLQVAKEPRSTGKHSQLNHFKGHVRQLSEPLGYEMRELEWIVLCEAMALGWPTQKVALRDGSVVDVPKDMHTEVEKKDFSLLIDILHEIAFDNDIVLREDDDSKPTPSPDEGADAKAEGDVPDSTGEVGEHDNSNGATPHVPSQHQAQQEEVPIIY